MLIRFVVVVFSAAFLFACAQDSDAPASSAGKAASDAQGVAAGAGQMAKAATTDALTTAAAVAGKVAVAAGDPEKGKRFYIFCQACHTLNSGGMNKVGPNLHGIFDSPAAQVEGFVYSDALSNSGITWDAAALDAWITRPSKAVPGTTMVFAGINDPQQRADLIAYLAQATAE